MLKILSHNLANKCKSIWSVACRLQVYHLGFLCRRQSRPQ